MRRRGRRHRLRLSFSRPGDYRLRAIARGARSRAVYLRVRRGGLRVRKDVADLSAAERARFVSGLLELKSTPSPYTSGLSWYDQFVAWHVHLSRCDPGDPLAGNLMKGHSGPMFLPWHRYYVVLLERALREVTGDDIAVPYWDWADPASTRAVFSDDFMGGDGDPSQDHAVTSGPFRKGRWELTVKNRGLLFGPSSTPYLTRHLGSFPLHSTLPSRADEQAALRAPLYDVAPFDDSSDPARSFRSALEGERSAQEPPAPASTTVCGPDGVLGTLPFGAEDLHNRAHTWVGGLLDPSPAGPVRGGTMTIPQASPNDPVFFLLHSNVDRLWAQWQETHGVHTYEPGTGLAHNSLHDPLQPFEETGQTTTVAEVLDIGELGYRYSLRDAPRAAVRFLCRPGIRSSTS